MKEANELVTLDKALIGAYQNAMANPQDDSIHVELVNCVLEHMEHPDALDLLFNQPCDNPTKRDICFNAVFQTNKLRVMAENGQVMDFDAETILHAKHHMVGILDDLRSEIEFPHFLHDLPTDSVYNRIRTFAEVYCKYLFNDSVDLSIVLPRLENEGTK